MPADGGDPETQKQQWSCFAPLRVMLGSSDSSFENVQEVTRHGQHTEPKPPLGGDWYEFPASLHCAYIITGYVFTL